MQFLLLYMGLQVIMVCAQNVGPVLVSLVILATSISAFFGLFFCYQSFWISTEQLVDFILD